MAKTVEYDIFDRLNIAGGMWLGGAYFEEENLGTGGIGESFEFAVGETSIYFATFDEDKDVIWATTYGGTGTDLVYDLTTDHNGNIYFVGETTKDSYATEMEFPIYSEYEANPNDYLREEYTYYEPVFSMDGFIVKFDDDRYRLLSTLFGGEKNDGIFEIKAVGDEVWFLGYTLNESDDFPYTFFDEDCFDQNDLMADKNAFIAIMDDEAEIIYLTYVGWIINSSFGDLDFNGDGNVISTGPLAYEDGEELGFAPVWKPNEYFYYSPLNPGGIEKTSCSYITEWNLWPIILTDVDDDLQLNSINVYPNPSEESITIEMNLDEVVQIEIYDIYGKLVLTLNSELTSKIDISNLPASHYIGKIQTKQGIFEFKFIKL